MLPCQGEDFLKAILDSATMVSVVVTDWDRNVLLWNKGAENIFGYTAEEIVGTSITRLYASDARTQQTVGRLREMVRTKHGTVHGQVKQITKSGELLTMAVAVTPLMSPDGQVLGLLGMGLDITEDAKKNEEMSILLAQLERSQQCLEMICRSSLALTTTADLDDFLRLTISELARAMEVEGAGVLLHDDRSSDFYWRVVEGKTQLLAREPGSQDLPFDKALVDRAMEAGTPIVVNDLLSGAATSADVMPAVEPAIRNLLVLPLIAMEKTIGVLVLANKDDGEFTAEDLQICVSLAGILALSVQSADFFQQLMRSYRKLEDLNRVKTKVLNRIAHELRTPIAIISGSLSLLADRLRGRGMSELDLHMARFNRQLESLRRLEVQVEDILIGAQSWEKQATGNFLEAIVAFIEVQAATMPEIGNAAQVIVKGLQEIFPRSLGEPSRINIEEFVRAVCDSVRSQLDGQKRSMSLVIDMEGDSEVMIPEHVLAVIMEGLVRNAVEATPDNGTVRVLGRRTGPNYRITVSDTGYGIPEQDQKLVMKGFYHPDATESYSTGRPYSFNAGGRGLDLQRIRVFSKIYELGFFFKSRRCEHLNGALARCPGDVRRCPACSTIEDCSNAGGSDFEVTFPLAASDADLQTL
ncbi:MAG: GAF domain-containing protein [Thermodesulfobacteriota bacterium]